MRTLPARLGIHPRRGFARALAAAPLVLLATYLVARGWLYPLWPDTVVALDHPFTANPDLGGAWGGPTLVGAWAVHAAIALAAQAVCVLGLRLLYPRAS
ncbi:hypothetical protein [Saccharothrix syringae]|uniref:Uncharacterized protein n=1 Tax=Saccharothrix syringae TaxID=103733 RepID=A0A5Q0H003_SACSY|nr:hypothetical protein [Saccharothrix syringae]QFZ19557.1 hypothetical protein EKG83_20850 [Saccharothrix syringae]